VCGAFGRWANQARTQEAAVDRILKLGGHVEFDYYHQAGGSGTPNGPAILRRWLGPHFFDRVDLVSLSARMYGDNPSGYIHVLQFDDSDVPLLTKLPGLRRLGLSNTSVTDDGLVHVGRVRSLESLSLHGTPITDIGVQHLSQLTNLKAVSLHGTQITNASMEILGALRQLESLTVGYTSVDDKGLEHLGSLTELETLWLCGNRVSVAGLLHLQSFETLKVLWLQDTQVNDNVMPHIARFQSLEQLFLTGCEGVSDRAVVHLSELSNLKEISLWKTSVTQKGIESLQAALPNCHISPRSVGM
jgi:hypothetical protein